MDHRNQPINWYPGHMAKTRRLLQEQLHRVDLVIELCDARLPFSSRNPELIRMISGKRHLLFLNKSDLADPASTSSWINAFKGEGIDAFVMNARVRKSKDALKTISNACSGIVEKAKERGIRKTVKAMVIGVPNVGKSTFINMLRGSSIAQTGDRPGVTKSNQWVRITPYLELLDTPGMLWPRLDDQQAARRLCYIGSVSDDVIDMESLAMNLLEDLKKSSPEAVKERFHLDSLEAAGVELLDAICTGRGWLLKGGQYDYERCFSVVLDEFRSGKLGRITLEQPEFRKEKADE